ncbi:uncharacterized protein zgc:194621 isoform X2 [Boleophthalmus pectinirostris]|uniref:uncharacterized protein zgc:194621 isoform X2 n=1 Tax=Boleophthalmus pectinirostris TaxID=150288 RepID=UPI00243124EB|nr:uncharacterized protein zgc:194621 isoform X2 [Boleophthalmus pectinirostris]
MSNPKVTKTNPLGTSKKPRERVKPLKVRETTGESELKLPCSVRGNRTASCSRCPPGESSEAASAGPKAAPNSQRRTRAASTPPKPVTQRCDAKTGNKKPRIPDKQTAETKCSQQRAQDQGQLSSTRHSHAAFTVICPDPKKRLEIQKKAEAELTALEELRVSKHTAYVSINPSAEGVLVWRRFDKNNNRK